MTIMKRDENICRRIMLQFEQKSVFSTTDYTDACHVGLLKDRGYIDADIVLNEEGCVASAVIHRITAIGYDMLDDKSSMPNASEDETKWYRRTLVEERSASQETFEKIHYLLASGGITLIVSLLWSKNLEGCHAKALLLITIILLSLNLGLLLILHGASIAAYNYQIRGLDGGTPRAAHANNPWSKVVDALYWIISVLFGICLILYVIGISANLSA